MAPNQSNSDSENNQSLAAWHEHLDEHDALLGGERLEEATAAAVPQSQRPESVQSSYPPLSPPAALSTTNPHRRERAHEARGDHNSQQAGDGAIACVDVVDARAELFDRVVICRLGAVADQL